MHKLYYLTRFSIYGEELKWYTEKDAVALYEKYKKEWNYVRLEEIGTIRDIEYGTQDEDNEIGTDEWVEYYIPNKTTRLIEIGHSGYCLCEQCNGEIDGLNRSNYCPDCGAKITEYVEG